MEPDLKRKRGDQEENVGYDPDMVQFGLHARHSWLNNASSTLKLPWDFRLHDQLDVVDIGLRSPCSGCQVLCHQYLHLRRLNHCRRKPVLQLRQIEISALKQSIVLTSVHGVIRSHMKGSVHIGNG